MSDLRKAAQQALEALEIGWSTTHTGKDARELGMKAITTLRAALAQQAEPEGSVCARCGALAFDPLVPQQAEPVEPVAALTAQRDALLEALQRLLAAYSVSHSPKHRQSCWDQARAAIKAVDEKSS